MSTQNDSPLVRIRNGDRRYYGIYRCSLCNREKEIYDYTVKRRLSKSCGCYRVQVTTERNKGNKYGLKHGGWKKPEYGVWEGIIQRCTNSNSTNYKNYGGRGIAVCERWQGKNGFANFFADMGKRPDGLQIERKDNDGNYEPSNCKWATRKEELRNTRRNRKVTFNGRTLCLMEWSIELGIHYTTLRNRIIRGWSIERALTHSVKKRKGSDVKRGSITDELSARG